MGKMPYGTTVAMTLIGLFFGGVFGWGINEGMRERATYKELRVRNAQLCEELERARAAQSKCVGCHAH